MFIYMYIFPGLCIKVSRYTLYIFVYPLHLLPTLPMNLHKQYNNISPLLFYSIIAFKRENGSTRMIQSLSSRGDLVVALASSKSSLGTCKTTMKKIIHPCVKNTKNIFFFKENTSYSLTVVVDVEAASKFLISYQFHQASTEKH